MKQKLLKSLLAVALLLAGGNVWAQIETIGANDFSTGWWSAFSSTYSLEGYGKYHFQFTTTNVNDGSAWKTWLLVATDGNDSHGGGGTEYFVWRGDNYAWGQGTDSNTVPDKLVCSTNYSIVNPTGAGLQAATNGASVDMVITRESNNIYATATVTPSNGESEFTMDFSFLYGTATSANVGLFLTVENAQVVLNTAEQTASWSTVWTTDFSSAPSGMTYSVTNGSTSISNGYLEYHQGGGSGNRALNTAFTDDRFNVDSDWILGFDWNTSTSNQNSSNVSFATNEAAAFTATFAQWATTATITAADATELTNTLPNLGYNKGECTSWSHVTITGVKGDGIYLTVTNGTTTYVDNVRVSTTFGYPATFNGSLGRAASHMYMDNIIFLTPVVAGFVAPPTSTITGTYNNDRKFTLECITPNTTIYYAASDLEKGDAGWSVYSGEVTTSEATIYAYAEDDKGITSDKMNFATGAGSIVNLVAATVTHSGNGKYTIANSQSSVLGTPTATVHYQIDGGAEQTSTNTSIDVNVAADGTLTYWLTADGYGSVDPEDETVYAPRAYAFTTTIDFRTSNANDWSSHGDAVDVDGDAQTYYKYRDQSGNIIGDGLLATTFNNATIDNSWRIQRYYGGTSPYAKTESVALKGLTAGQIVQIECTSAPTIVSNLTVLPASTYTGTYTYTATADGDVIVSLEKGFVLQTIKLCSTTTPVSISALGWATMYTPYALDFSGMSGSFTAYTATVAGSTITLNPVTEVPANTGVVLNGDEGSYNVPVITSSAEEQGALTGNAAAATAYDAFDGYTLYALAQAEDYPTHQVQFRPVAEGSIAAGKAFLKIANGSLVKAFDIDIAGADAISDVRSKMEDGRNEIFNLAGQRMNRLQKGVNIVNGKKILVK